MRFLWKKDAEGEAVLYRIYGRKPVVKVPEEIDGCPVAALGAYCFSDRNRIPEDIYDTAGISGKGLDSVSITELTGDFVEEIILPDTLKRIDNAAFFNCRKLRCIEIGKGALTIGSDVFNNCTDLTTTMVRASVREKSSVKQVLDRISWDIEVRFDDARIFYPEYYESYDTIAPAHIFGLSIEGEGFRARQCFRDDRVDLPGYDDVFGKACAEESLGVLAVMAVDRLMTPVELGREKKQVYEEYLIKNSGDILEYFVRKRELHMLEFMYKNRYAREEALDRAVGLSVSGDWSEGAASLMEWKQKMSGECRKNRYQF